MKDYKGPSVSFYEFSIKNNIMSSQSVTDTLDSGVDDYSDTTKQNRTTFDAFFAD